MSFSMLRQCCKSQAAASGTPLPLKKCHNGVGSSLCYHLGGRIQEESQFFSSQLAESPWLLLPPTLLVASHSAGFIPGFPVGLIEFPPPHLPGRDSHFSWCQSQKYIRSHRVQDTSYKGNNSLRYNRKKGKIQSKRVRRNLK